MWGVIVLEALYQLNCSNFRISCALSGWQSFGTGTVKAEGYVRFEAVASGAFLGRHLDISDNRLQSTISFIGVLSKLT